MKNKPREIFQVAERQINEDAVFLILVTTSTYVDHIFRYWMYINYSRVAIFCQHRLLEIALQLFIWTRLTGVWRRMAG
jgi:hypothetical protein